MLDADTENALPECPVRRLESALPQIWGRRVHSVFIGGGTPSLFSPQGVDRLLADVRPACRLTLTAKSHWEANPGTFGKLIVSKHSGKQASTVCQIGVQSFDDQETWRWGVHSGDQARGCGEEAAACFKHLQPST